MQRSGKLSSRTTHRYQVKIPPCSICRVAGMAIIYTHQGTYSLCNTHFWPYYREFFTIEYPPEVLEQFKKPAAKQESKSSRTDTSLQQPNLL
jgi:hypothetical protein